jgi:YD repeat-containing protein
VLENGDFLYFPRVSKGTGYSDAVYRQSEVGNSFYKATQKWDGNGWLMQLQDGSTIRFPESYSAESVAQGAPTEMTDSKGNKITLLRDGRRNLLEIRSAGGNSIKLGYDNHNRIVRADSSQGAWTTYAYETSGFLSDVAHSDGTARHYSYDGGLLRYVRDEQMRVLVHNFYYYAGDYLMRQEYGNGSVFKYSYQPSFNGKYAVEATITLPDGSVKTVQTRDSVSEVYKRMQ